jgi:hypothetical protein
MIKNQLKCFLKLASKLSTSIFMKIEITSKFYIYILTSSCYERLLVTCLRLLQGIQNKATQVIKF